MSSLHEVLSHQVVGAPVADWLWAAAAFALTFLVLPLANRYLLHLMHRPIVPGEFALVQLLRRIIAGTSRIFVLIVAVNAAERFVHLDRPVQHGLHALILIGFWWQVGLWSMTSVQFGLERRRDRTPQSDAHSSFNIVLFLARGVVWSTVSLLALDNLGVDVTALIAGLGIGGIAVALAAQTVLGDLIASVSIALDKPFSVGDQLVLDDVVGKVEHIGVRSTHIRSVGGEQVIVANSTLVKARVRNFGRMTERRCVLRIGIAYETPLEQVRQATQLVAGAITTQDTVRLDRCHFAAFGASSLDIEAVYYVLQPEMAAAMAAHQAIGLRILQDFKTARIEIAYPTQLLAIAGSPRATDVSSKSA